jgi:TRAP transporter TAXI family solute receptor
MQRPLLVATLIGAVQACSASATRRETPVELRVLFPSPTVNAGTANAFATLKRQWTRADFDLQATNGSLVVAADVQTGAGDIGLAQADVAYQAYRKGTAVHPYPHTNLRGIALAGVNRLFVFVRRDSDLRRIQDLRGHRVTIAPDVTAGALLSREVLEAYGLSLSDVTVSKYQPRAMGEAFEREHLDAMILVGNFEPKTITAPISTHELRMLPVDGEGLTRLRAKYLFLTPTVVSASELPDLHEDIPTIGVYSLYICRQDLPEEIVYEFIKHFPKQSGSTSSLALDPDSAPATPIPLHPGAARYYRELQLLQ